MHLLGIIPARLGSTRLPNKPLRLLAGLPLAARVANHVRGFGICERVVVATDAQPVLEALEALGIEAVLTDPRHESGTERVAEVVTRQAFRSYELILNVQGDEPFLPPAAATAAVARVREGQEPIGTAAAPLEPEAAGDPHRVKVVTDARGRALYFSRAPIPFVREGPPERGLFWQHIGVYAYTREALREWTSRPPVALERAERLEQLRPLSYGMPIGVARLETPAPRGIDTEDDLRWAEDLFPALSAASGGPP